MSGINYEREMKEILTEKGFFVVRIAGSLGGDLLAIYNCYPFIVEVKSSRKDKIYMSNKRLLEQYEYYKEIERTYGIETVYMYRLITGKRIDDKWRVFKNLERTPQENPLLTWENGMHLTTWIIKTKTRLGV